MKRINVLFFCLSFAGENTAYLRYEGSGASRKIKLDVSSGNSTDTFEYRLHYTSNGSVVDEANWTTFNNGSDAKAGSKEITGNFDKNKSLQVEVRNVGTQEVFYSNSITIQ